MPTWPCSAPSPITSGPSKTASTAILRLTTIEDNRELVRVSLLRAIQKYPDNTVFPELLVWHFNQIRDFASSVIHAKALDLRLDEQGVRLMELGNTAQANGDTDTALECYRYVASKGPRQPVLLHGPQRGAAGAL